MFLFVRYGYFLNQKNTLTRDNELVFQFDSTPMDYFRNGITFSNDASGQQYRLPSASEAGLAVQPGFSDPLFNQGHTHATGVTETLPIAYPSPILYTVKSYYSCSNYNT